MSAAMFLEAGTTSPVRVLDAMTSEIRGYVADVDRHVQGALTAAIACGHLLIEAHEAVVVDGGDWREYLRDVVGLHYETAKRWQRLAVYEDSIPSTAMTVNEARDALKGLPPATKLGPAPKLPPERVAEAQRLKDAGWTWSELCRRFGVSETCIRYNLSADFRRTHNEERQARKDAERARKAEAKKAQAALRRERASAAARGAGGPLAEAYALTRQACQQTDHAISSAEGEERRALELALAALHQAEDEITRALGVA